MEKITFTSSNKDIPNPVGSSFTLVLDGLAAQLNKDVLLDAGLSVEANYDIFGVAQ